MCITLYYIGSVLHRHCNRSKIHAKIIDKFDDNEMIIYHNFVNQTNYLTPTPFCCLKEITRICRIVKLRP